MPHLDLKYAVTDIGLEAMNDSIDNRHYVVREHMAPKTPEIIGRSVDLHAV